ncbi:hypothetical protein [Endozoicomonas elysicola]|uniref:hypothetical protein n=1 Tax=Endozoicomonas elysicola TaxID=305900 RepID=UPI0012685B61|nr:hypothetical protein [Endozoicomonas elysicola]
MKYSESIGASVKTSQQYQPQSTLVDSTLDSRSITGLPTESSSRGAEEFTRTHEITITDLGKTLDIEAVWDEIDYYLESVIKVSPEHLEKTKEYLQRLEINEFQYFEDLVDHLVDILNDREKTEYPLIDDVKQDDHHATQNKTGGKLWRFGKYMTAVLAVDAGLKYLVTQRGADAASIRNNGTSLSQPENLTLSYRFISDSGFSHVITKPDSAPTPVLPDICLTQGPSSGRTTELVEGEPVCIPDGDDLSYFYIGESDKQKSIAISTGHGRGDLSVFVGSGQWPDLSAEPASSHPNNTECVVLEKPEQHWTTIAVKGHKDKASLAVDFNTDACRLPVRRGFTHETHVRTNGYPYKSAHLLVYKLNFSDAQLDWPNLEEDLQSVKEYYKRQSYDNFDVSWEMVEVNLGESIEKYNNGTWTEWINRCSEVVKKTGVNPGKPGRNNLVLLVSPPVKDYNSSGGRSYMHIYDKHNSAEVIAHEVSHAMGLRHAKALEAGTEVIKDMPDNDRWYNCHKLKTQSSDCVEKRNQYFQEYGNVYSLMGKAHGRNRLGEMNLLYKSFFGWVDLDTDVPMASTSGRYRIYAFDHADKSNGPIGLRLQSGNGKYTYWLEYRTTEPYSENAKQGVLINLEGYAEHETEPEYWRTTSYLLDMTPESGKPSSPYWKENDYADSALTIGEIYTDKWGGFRIRPNRVGGTEDTANAWIEVEVVTRKARPARQEEKTNRPTSRPRKISSSTTTNPVTASLSTLNSDSTVLSVTKRAPLTSTSEIPQNSVAVPHNVAVVYLKDQMKSPRFDSNTLQERVTLQVDSLIRSNSYNREGFGKVEKFGWLDIDSEAWNTALRSRRWTDLAPVVQAKQMGALNLDNYDYVLTVWDDTEGNVSPRGTADPNKHDVVIDGTTYTDKSTIDVFLKPNSLENHCFYKQQNYRKPELCYTNPAGENLKEFEGVIFHEFLHTKKLAHHSVTEYCDDVLLGKCSSGAYNMFDALSSARFFGNSLNAHDKHRINWLTDDDIVTLAPGSGHHEVTLHHLNSDVNGKKAVKIDYQAFSGFDIWLEFRQPTELDYGLYNEAFDKVTHGLLIYKDNQLLDATPETRAIDFVDQRDVSITESFDFEPLGLNINILDVDSSAKTIHFRVNLHKPQPVRNPPLPKASRCNRRWDCNVLSGTSFTTKYRAKLTDIGYGAQFNKPWEYTLIGLPAGITWSDNGVKRQYSSNPSMYSASPHTYITLSVDASVKPGTYPYTMRFLNPDDHSKYKDLSQVITVVD